MGQLKEIKNSIDLMRAFEQIWDIGPERMHHDLFVRVAGNPVAKYVKIDRVAVGPDRVVIYLHPEEDEQGKETDGGKSSADDSPPVQEGVREGSNGERCFVDTGNGRLELLGPGEQGGRVKDFETIQPACRAIPEGCVGKRRIIT